MASKHILDRGGKSGGAYQTQNQLYGNPTMGAGGIPGNSAGQPRAATQGNDIFGQGGSFSSVNMYLKTKLSKEQEMAQIMAELKEKEMRRMAELQERDYDKHTIDRKIEKNRQIEEMKKNIESKLKDHRKQDLEEQIMDHQEARRQREMVERQNDVRMMNQHDRILQEREQERLQERYRYFSEQDHPNNQKQYYDEPLKRRVRTDEHQIMPGAGGIFGNLNAPTEEDRRRVDIGSIR